MTVMLMPHVPMRKVAIPVNVMTALLGMGQQAPALVYLMICLACSPILMYAHCHI